MSMTPGKPQIIISLSYERRKSRVEMAGNPQGDPRKNHCRLCYRSKGEELEHLLQVCTALTADSIFNESYKDELKLNLLPTECHGLTFKETAFPVAFTGIQCRPLDGETWIHLETNYEMLANCDFRKQAFHALLSLLFCCAVPQSAKTRAARKAIGVDIVWSSISEEIWWGCDSDSTALAEVVEDVCETVDSLAT